MADFERKSIEPIALWIGIALLGFSSHLPEVGAGEAMVDEAVAMLNELHGAAPPQSRGMT